jgi:hypothetical protein
MIFVLFTLAFLSGLPAWLELIVLLGAALGAVVTIKKYVWKPIRRFNTKINRGMDTLLGYSPVLDPATGREIQAATPPLANRVYELEKANSKIAEALETLANTQKAVVRLEEAWNHREAAGLQIVQEWTDWRDMHEKEAQQREERLAEWDAWRQEQNIMMEAIRNVHEGPHDDV